MSINLQEAAAAVASTGGSLLPPEVQAVLDLTGCAAVVVAIVLFLRHLKFERESRDAERKEFLKTMETLSSNCATERDQYLKMIERIEAKFADVVEDLVRDTRK